jgi:hypothetical protein
MDRCNVRIDQSGKMSINHGDIQTALVTSAGGRIVSVDRVL